eukprot:10399-Hanusia_phi.AAC.2
MQEIGQTDRQSVINISINRLQDGSGDWEAVSMAILVPHSLKLTAPLSRGSSYGDYGLNIGDAATGTVPSPLIKHRRDLLLTFNQPWRPSMVREVDMTSTAASGILHTDGAVATMPGAVPLDMITGSNETLAVMVR